MAKETFLRDIVRRGLDNARIKGLSDSQKGHIMRMVVREMQDSLTFMILDIADFHEKYGLAYEGGPRQLGPELAKFRSGFMQEELDEYKEACEKNDLEGQFDALVDLAYVVLGTAYLQGLPFIAGWDEVHSANMKKIRTENPGDSKRGSSFDVVKPPNWKAPDLAQFLQPGLFDD